MADEPGHPVTTHSYGMQCRTHHNITRQTCSCGTDHGYTTIECGAWCPESTIDEPERLILIFGRDLDRVIELEEYREKRGWGNPEGLALLREAKRRRDARIAEIEKGVLDG